MTRPDIHGAIVRSLTDTQRERLRGFDLTNIADAVIRELGLREEWLVDDIEPYDTREQAAERKAELIGDYGDDPPAEGVPVRFRYVTDWKADDLLPPCDPKCGPQTHVAGCSQRRYETDEGGQPVSPLEVDCPTCGAKGTPEDAPKRYRCRTLKTNRSTDAHVERWYARWPNTPEKGNRQ